MQVKTKRAARRLCLIYVIFICGIIFTWTLWSFSLTRNMCGTVLHEFILQVETMSLAFCKNAHPTSETQFAAYTDANGEPLPDSCSVPATRIVDIGEFLLKSMITAVLCKPTVFRRYIPRNVFPMCS